ncbi:DUF2339 domain-containing protein [Silvibacterium sp.]|uniref:DUF2339 domain-containing protein n=1 Tax=Silvibacterium sp. TaxID=1964179 RepID=UPI0039E506B2
MTDDADELDVVELRREVAALRARVERLEQQARVDAVASRETTPASPPAFSSPPQPVASAPATAWQHAPAQTSPPPGTVLRDISRALHDNEASRGSGTSQDSRSSLERKIGSQLFNRIGIVAVLIGVAWFLKLAIDNGWIGPAVRVMIGIAGGIGVAGLAERFRRKGYQAFAYSLQAVATGVLYLSLWAAYSIFHLIPGSVAFLTMVLVTAMNAWLSWRQNSEILAFYAAVGGFLTPLLLSAHASDELALFGYLLVLDASVVALLAARLHQRPWSRLLLAAFAGTTFYAVGWYASSYEDERFGATLFFVLVFFLIFALSPALLLRQARSTVSETRHPLEESLALRLLPVLNALVVFCELFVLFGHPPYAGLREWIPLPFVAFYLVLQRLSGARAATTEIALAGAFATIAIPMEAHGRWITVGWFLEFGALTWLAARRRPEVAAASSLSRPLFLTASGVLVLAVFSLIAPVEAWHPPVLGPLLLNTRFASWVLGAGVCAWAMRLGLAAAAREKQGSATGYSEEWRNFAAANGLVATALLLIAVCMEIHAYWATGNSPLGNSLGEQFSYSAWFMLAGAALLAMGFWQKSAFLRWQALVLLSLSIAKVFLFDTRQLDQGYRILSFLGLGALLLAVSFVYQKDWLSLRNTGSRHQ